MSKKENEAVWLVSYPRSGSTWMRFLLKCIQHPDVAVSYKTVDKYIPDFHQNFLGEFDSVFEKELALWIQGFNWSPVVIKSHFQIVPWYNKVIYMYRDVRDVLVSYYYYDNQRRLSKDSSAITMTFKEFFDKFLRGDFPWGSWHNHVNFWTAFALVDKCIVSYEELFVNTFKTMKRVVEFLGLKTTDEIIKQAIDKVSFDKIKRIAARDSQHENLRGLHGSPGGGKGSLLVSQQRALRERFGDIAKNVGYDI